MRIAWDLGDVARIVGGKLRGAGEGRKLTGVSTDSRTVRSGALFIALQGERFDGHNYVGDAAAAGAAAALVERPVAAAIPQVVVADTREALRMLAGARRRDFRGPVVAVTGSCGKTTTKDLIAEVLARKFRTRVSPGNFNNEVGVPLSILSLGPEDEALVVELAVSAPAEMPPLADAAAPTVAVITNVAPTHLEFFGTVAGVRREKMALLHFIAPGGTAVLNADDPLVASMAGEVDAGVAVVTFGLGSKADVHPRELLTEGLGGSRFRLEGGAEVALAIPGEYNVANALAAAAVGKVLDVPEEDIAAGLAAYRGRPLRGAVARDSRGATYFVDCYNSSPQAAKVALAFLAQVPRRGRRVAVLGDMLELGEVSDAAHRGVGRAAREYGFDLVVGVGGGGRAIVEGARAAGMDAAAARAFATAEELASFLATALAEGDVVLVKASRRVRLEDVLTRLGVPT